MFVVHSATTAHPLIPLALFRDRNLMLANLFLLVSAGIMMAGAALIAPMLQRMMGYGVVDAGMMMMPRGVAMMLSMILAGRLVAMVDPRFLIGGGLAICAVSQFMMTDFTLQMGPWLVILSGFIQGVGFGLVILPLNLLAFATLAPRLVTEGAALYSLSRNVGGSIAISVTTALIARNLQISHSDLSAHVTTVSLPFVGSGMIERLGLHAEQLMLLIDAEVNRQALMIAYIDDFWLMAWAAVVVTPLAIFMKAGRAPKRAPPVVE
jgi:DHA2 family multidrug resistance protein